MKKFLAALLAVLMLFSVCCISVFAEETTEPETDPETTSKEYEICQDSDFSNVVYLEAGNEKATLLKPGDKIFTDKKDAKKITIQYYPDADARSKGDWVISDRNNIAFSPSGKEFEKDEVKVNSGVPVATLKDIDFTDFTIAYSDENTFLGWVVYEYVGSSSSNTIVLCAVWDKKHKVSTGDDVDDFQYIVDTHINAWKAIFAPFTTAIKWLSNAVLYVYNYFYNLIFGAKSA